MTWLSSLQAGSGSVTLSFCVWLLPWPWCSSLLLLPSLTNTYLLSFSLPYCFDLLTGFTFHFLHTNFHMTSAYCLIFPFVYFAFCPLPSATYSVYLKYRFWEYKCRYKIKSIGKGLRLELGEREPYFLRLKGKMWKKVKVKVKSCLTIWDSMDCNPPGSSIVRKCLTVGFLYALSYLSWALCSLSVPVRGERSWQAPRTEIIEMGYLHRISFISFSIWWKGLFTTLFWYGLPFAYGLYCSLFPS